jgi:hypothetical protein
MAFGSNRSSSSHTSPSQSNLNGGSAAAAAARDSASYGNGNGAAAAGNGNGAQPSSSYVQYLADGGIAPKPQRRAGKDWLPYQGERQLIISIDLGACVGGAKWVNRERGLRRRAANAQRTRRTSALRAATAHPAPLLMHTAHLAGTTYSGASYCILEPGKKPRIEDCRAYPGQASGLCE